MTPSNTASNRKAFVEEQFDALVDSQYVEETHPDDMQRAIIRSVLSQPDLTEIVCRSNGFDIQALDSAEISNLILRSNDSELLAGSRGLREDHDAYRAAEIQALLLVGMAVRNSIEDAIASETLSAVQRRKDAEE